MIIKSTSSIVFYLAVICAVFISCKKTDIAEESTAQTKAHYVLMSTSSGLFGPGYFGAYDQLPSGSMTNVNANSTQIASAFGFRSYGKWFFNQSNAAGDAGLQKYSVDDKNAIIDQGFLPHALPSWVILNETKGYYIDTERGTLKIQIFNPSTMQRMGEIDLSSLKKAGVEYQIIGRHTLAIKEGKLYAGITYGTTQAQGFGDDTVNYVEFAVIDAASDKFEKTIRYDGLSSVGWGSSGNKMWTLGDDGALYFYATDLGRGFANSSIIRINKGETEFDKTWVIKSNDYMLKNTLGIGLVRNGKLYTQFASEELKSDNSNLVYPIFEYYAIDLTTKVRTKLTNIPTASYAWANDQAITEIDGKLCFWVANSTKGLQGYYQLNADNSATQLFNLRDGGTIWGFVKLQ